ncbi:MAG TPA: serine/threonine-protein kinase [Kofleriaceae bacterium]|nr:serine/threonine-protein kinase [Kofleriaceae bacterium]
MSQTRIHTGPVGPPIEGSILGSYRIRGEISSGGMGAVFRAEHVLLGRPAAVKVLRPDLTTDADLVHRFVNEARAVTACKHPGIVEVYDFGYTAEGHAFYVMELLEGESLARRLARSRLREIEAAAIALGIASALKAAHRVGVIHRDLKPDNVFLVPDPDGGPDRTKVLDFGIAKLGDTARAPGRRTQTGILMGTPLYMAPEQARAAGMIDGRADLYSLGCMLYHMLVGRPPFVANGAGEIIALQMFGEVEPPSRTAPVSPELERLVLRLLEKDPADRFQSAAELVTELAVFDTVMTNRPTWPSGHPAVAGASDGAESTTRGGRGGSSIDASQVMPSPASGPLPGTGESKPERVEMPQEPELRSAAGLAGDAGSERAPRRRTPLILAGALAVAALGGLLGFALLRGGGPAPASAGSAGAPASPVPAAPPARADAPSSAPATLPAAAPAAVQATTAATTAAPTAAAIDVPAPPPAPLGGSPSPRAPSPPPRPHSRQGAPGHAAKPGARGDASASTGRAGLDVPDRAIEVIREDRPVDPSPPPSSPGAHTVKGSPIEVDISIGRPRPSPGDARNRSPAPPAREKDPTTP